MLVWKLDRWGRSLADCVRSIQELAALGVRFVAKASGRSGSIESIRLSYPPERFQQVVSFSFSTVIDACRAE